MYKFTKKYTLSEILIMLVLPVYLAEGPRYIFENIFFIKYENYLDEFLDNNFKVKNFISDYSSIAFGIYVNNDTGSQARNLADLLFNAFNPFYDEDRIEEYKVELHPGHKKTDGVSVQYNH